MFRTSLKNKLIGALVAAGVLPVLLVAAALLFLTTRTLNEAHGSSEAALHEQVEASLESVRDNKVASVEAYFQTIQSQIVTFTRSTMVVDAMAGFRGDFKTFREQSGYSTAEASDSNQALIRYYQQEFATRFAEERPEEDLNVQQLVSSLDPTTVALQHSYMAQNPHPLGSKQLLDADPGESSYAKRHARIHPILREYQQKFGFYDVFLVDAETGDIVYSVFKEVDFATSLVDGPYAGTNFAAAFDTVRGSSSADAVTLVDFECYRPSYDAPASFVASPIHLDGKEIGIGIFQLPLDRISNVMDVQSGLGDTGESYLVGPQGRMRSDSRRDPEHRTVVASFRSPAEGTVLTEAQDRAHRGEAGVVRQKNYADEDVISAFSPVNIGDMHWALIAEIGANEALQPVTEMRAEAGARQWSMVWVTLALLVLATGITSFAATVLARKISAPITETAEILGRVADGDLTERATVVGECEIGSLATSLNQTIEGVATALGSERVDWIAVSEQKVSLDQVASLVECSSLAMVFADTEGVVQHANPRSVEVLRCNPLGAQLESLHPTEAKLAAVLQAGALPWSDQIELHGEHITLDVTEATSPDGDYLGTILRAEVVTDKVLAAKKEDERKAAELAKAQTIQSGAKELLAAVDEASRGDLTVTIPELSDETLSSIASALGNLLVNFREKMSAITVTERELSESADTLLKISSSMKSVALHTKDSVEGAGTSSEEVDARVSSVAAATLELETSIEEIARKTTRVAEIANEAVTHAAKTNDGIQHVQTSSGEIEDVLNVISSIAAQTNLLALNATIEAARAGSAGKGFAVVADEVKSLASETARATEGIAERISSMQDASRQAGERIAEFTSVVDEISDAQTTIASAVQEQSATSREIGINASEAASGATGIHGTILAVATEVGETTESAEKTANSAHVVSSAADKLAAIVRSFRV